MFLNLEEFESVEEASLEKSQLKFMDEFIKQIPELIIEQRSVQSERDKHNESLDLAERSNSGNIDDFEKVNDFFGQITGDKVLCSMADIFRALFTDVEYISRVGEDTFAVFVPRKLDSRYLKDKTEQMRRALNININDMRITCSIGVAQSPSCGTDPETLYKNCETALHTAKKSGKNRCVFFKKGMTSAEYKNINERTEPLLDEVSDAMFICEAKTNKIIFINISTFNI